MVANKNQNQDLFHKIATPLAYLNSEKKTNAEYSPN